VISNGLTYKCTKCIAGKVPDDDIQIYTCTMVHNTKDNTWSREKQTQDKLHSDRTKCGGTIIIKYSQMFGHTVMPQNDHICSMLDEVDSDSENCDNDDDDEYDVRNIVYGEK
jgi:hypothetical protein